MDLSFAQQFPALAETRDWGTIQSRFEFTDRIRDLKLVSNVNLIPFVNDRCVMIRLDNGNWELPGGTLEPGEHYLETMKRELLEEAGAELLGFHVLGAIYCHSKADKPYKPHIPHPHFIRLIGYGEVKLIAAPTNPSGAEHVVSVVTVRVEEAMSRFESIGRPDLAELYKLAWSLKEKKLK